MPKTKPKKKTIQRKLKAIPTLADPAEIAAAEYVIYRSRVAALTKRMDELKLVLRARLENEPDKKAILGQHMAWISEESRESFNRAAAELEFGKEELARFYEKSVITKLQVK